MKVLGYSLIALGVAFILAGVTLLLAVGSPINFVTIANGAVIIVMGIITVGNARVVERIDRQLGKY